MADAIVVLNAGSSSIKFSLFAEARRRACAGRRRAGRGHLHRAALRREGRRRQDGEREAVGGRYEARPRRRARAHRRLAAGDARRGSPARRGRPSRRPRRDRLRRAGARRRRASWRSSRSSCRSRRCTSRTTSRRSARCSQRAPELPQVACFDTAFHRSQPAARADVRAAAGADRRRRAALRLPRSVLRVHRLGAAAVRRARGARQDGGAASRQRREHVRARGRPQRRQHDGLHRGRRPADGHALRRDRSGRDPLPDGRAQAWTRARSRS